MHRVCKRKNRTRPLQRHTNHAGVTVSVRGYFEKPLAFASPPVAEPDRPTCARSTPFTRIRPRFGTEAPVAQTP